MQKNFLQGASIKPKQNSPHDVQTKGGSKAFWTMFKKTALFSRDGFPNPIPHFFSLEIAWVIFIYVLYARRIYVCFFDTSTRNTSRLNNWTYMYYMPVECIAYIISSVSLVRRLGTGPDPPTTHTEKAMAAHLSPFFGLQQMKTWLRLTEFGLGKHWINPPNSSTADHRE